MGLCESVQIIVVISTIIVKIYSVASRGRRHIAEPRKFLVSYYLLSLFFNLVQTDLFHLTRTIGIDLPFSFEFVDGIHCTSRCVSA